MGRKKWAAVAVLAVIWSAVGFTGAYMMDTPEKLKNMITPGSIEVQVTETMWQPENGMQLVPGSEAEKNPAVKNTGKNAAWVFLKIKIPVREICLVDSVTRKKKAAEKTEMFSFDTSVKWQMLENVASDKYNTYVYGYQQITEPGQITEELFDKVKLVNYLEGELDDQEEFFIPVEAQAIQTNVCETGADLKTVYQQFLKQKMAE